MQHGTNELIELGRAVEDALARLGFERERKEFKPHITLARLKMPKSIENALSDTSDGSFKGRIVNVDGITIFRSHLKPTGAEYESVRYIPLPS